MQINDLYECMILNRAPRENTVECSIDGTKDLFYNFKYEKIKDNIYVFKEYNLKCDLFRWAQMEISTV